MTLTRRELLRSAFHPPQVPESPPDVDITAAPLFRPLIRNIPQIDPRYWALSIGGNVKHPLTVTYDELLAMPAVDLPCTLLCASNPPGGERISTAVWRGVDIWALLREMGVENPGYYIKLEGYNGYTTYVTRSAFGRGILAYAANGEMLTPEQGFPARLIIPRYFDQKSVRWLQRIELFYPREKIPVEERNRMVAWVQRPAVGITSPRPFELTGLTVCLEGYAYAGLREVRQINLSIDDGPWTSIPFEDASRDVWTRWQTTWTAPGPGDYQITAQARARTHVGKVGWPTHSIVVRVREA